MIRKPSGAFKPFAHQVKSLKRGEQSEIIYDCSDPGTGKTYVRVMTYLMRHLSLRKPSQNTLSKKCLVLAPRSLLRTVWQADFKKFAPHVRVAISTAGKHEAVFAQDADVYVTNIDAIKWLAQQKKAFFDQFDEIIIDESTAYKHHSSQRSRAAAKVCKFFKYRTAMTGTPTSLSITDIWHQILILDEGKRLGKSFYAFRNTVCTPTQVGRNENAIQWADKDGAEEAVFGLLSDIVIRHKFEDCVDIPANHQYSVPYYLPPKHLKAYEELLETCMLQIYGSKSERAKARVRGVPLKPKATVTAQHAGVLATKVLQLLSGAVYESPGKYHVIDDARYEMITDMIEARKHSFTMFYWNHQRDMLVELSKKRGIEHEVIDGNTGDDRRLAIVNAYQRGDLQTLFAHPKSAAHGLTLTKGTATIWPGPTSDLELFKQGSKRQHRIGQTQKTETITILAEDTVELRTYDRLLGRGSRAANLLDLFSTL